MKIETDIWNKMKLSSGGDIYSVEELTPEKNLKL